MQNGTVEGYRLSPQQKHLWLQENSARVQCAVRITGRVDLSALRAAWAELIRRHEILRTAFVSVPGVELPLQVIREQVEAELLVGDEGVWEELWRQKFDYESGAVVRGRLVQVWGAEQELVVSVSGMCADSQTLKNLVAELGRGYEAALSGAVLTDEPVQYADYAEWQNRVLEAADREAERAFWNTHSAAERAVQLPWEERSELEGETGVEPVEVGAELLERLEARRAVQQVSMSVLLLGCWQVLLRRLSGSSDLTILTAFDGRKYEDLENALGLFSKYLPISNGVVDQSFGVDELLRATDEAVRAARAREEYYSYPAVQESRAVVFEYEEAAAVARYGESEWEVRRLETALEDAGLRLRCVRGEQELRLELHYEQLAAATVQRWSGSLLRILEAVSERAEVAVGRVALLPAAERRQLVEEWNASEVDYGVSESLGELFARQAERTPAAVAVVSAVETVSYGELNERANQLGHYLQRLGVGPEQVVGLCLERSVTQVLSLLGVLKAGGAYLPLEPSYPEARLRYMLEQAGTKVVLTHGAVSVPSGAWTVVRVDHEWEQIALESAAEPRSEVSGENLAYVLYTSGTTGRPKGVMIRQRAVVNLWRALDERVYGGVCGRRVSVNAPLSFDASVKQWVRLLSGDTLCVVPEAVRGDGEQLLAWLAEAGVEVLDCTPGQLRLLVAAGLFAHEWQPELVLVGGEAIEEQLWQELSASSARDGVQYYNVYGPTECTVDASCAVVSGAQPVLGRVLGNVRGYVLDEWGEVTATGVRGELYLGGAGVARGYLGQPALTAERFVPDGLSGRYGERLYRTGDECRYESSGELAYVGRLDEQVKVRGYRIELGEIAGVLEEHEGVAEAVVAVREAGPGDQRLVAYVVGRGEVQRAGVRRHRLANGLAVAEQNRNETEYLYEEIFVKRSYLRHGVALGAGAVVFDVGANIGMFTLFAAQESAGARIYAFEPVAEIYESLRRNAGWYGGHVQEWDGAVSNGSNGAAHGVNGSGWVKLFAAGLSDHDGEEAFSYYRRYSMMSGQQEYAAAGEEREVIDEYLRNEAALGKAGAAELLAASEELLAGRFAAELRQCRVRRLSEVMQAEGVEWIDLLKVDVQRAELDVLRGVDEADWERIGQVVLEVHDREGGRGRVREVVELLERHGFAAAVEQEANLQGTDRYNVYAVSATERARRAAAPAAPTPVSTVAEWRETGAGEWDEEQLRTELRRHLRQRLPGYMVPGAIVVLPRLPLTRHGKVDRQALPAPEVVGSSSGDGYVGPRTPVEELVSGIYGQVLGLAEVGVEENFFELGGHSLLATQVVSRVRESFGVELALRKLFESPTVAGLSREVMAALNESSGNVAPPLRAVERVGPAPLSFAQQRLWFLDQLEPGSAFYNSPLAVRLTGRLEVEALERTLSEIVRRHESLRTRFATVDGQPVQLIDTAPAIRLNPIELSELPESEREIEARRLAKAEAEQPFDLSTGPLLRVQLLRLAEEDHVVLFTMHHIISDGWSLGVLVKEVAALYEAYIKGEESPLPELELQYADYAAWQREWLQGAVLAEQLSYWQRQLGGELPVLELPTDRPRPAVQSYRGARESLTLSAELTQQLKALSQREGCTLFMTLLAAFQVLLSRYSGQDDIVIGTDIANRNHAETEPLIGFFVNQLVMRTDLSGNPTFSHLLRQVRSEALGAYAHQDIPFEKLVEELQPERDLSRSPLFQVKLILQNAPLDTLELPNLKLSPLNTESQAAKCDLTLAVRESSGELRAACTYNTDIFSAPTIQQMMSHFRKLLESVVLSPDRELSALSMLTADEERQLLVQWNDTAKHFPSACGIHSLFEEQAAHTPDAVAVVYEQEQLSYRELNEQANRLAHHLRELGVGPEVLVGLCLERSLEMIVSVLAVLKAGGAYVPLDPTYPAERLTFMVQDAGLKLVVTSSVLAVGFDGHDTALLQLDADWERVARQPAQNLPPLTAEENLAYVIYTSGSTGAAKGIMVEQRQLLNYLHSISEFFEPAAGAHFAVVSTFAADLGHTVIFPSLCRGGCLHVISQERISDAEALAQYFTRHRIDYVKIVPSHLSALVTSSRRERLLPRRLLVLGGEASSWDWIESLTRISACEWLNHYGPTETTVGALTYSVKLDQRREGRETVPIGRPLANMRVYILNARRQPVAIGVAGELHIGGAGVSRGYLKRADWTAEKFIPDPFSATPGARMYKSGDLARYLSTGEIEFVGRIDHQVKLRGYRIEPGEIETALSQHPSVNESVVLTQVNEQGQQQLVAYVAAQPASLTIADCRSFLKDRLPGYMIPSSFVVLDSLPLTNNGKVDRKALAALRPASLEVAPEDETSPTPFEEMLKMIWAELLRTDRFSTKDNFFEIGGHSLLATQFISRVREIFQIEMPLRRVFEFPSIKGLARQVEQAKRAGQSVLIPPITRVSRDAVLPLSFAQQRLWFLDQLEPQSASYNMPGVLRLHGVLDLSALERTISEIVRRHEVLRTLFVALDGVPAQVVQPAEFFDFASMDLSAMPEREIEMRRVAIEEAHRPFDLAQGPLLRVRLLRLADEEHVVLFTMHHIISDGWSLGVLVREVAALYAAYIKGEESPLPELELQYADYAAWQREWLQGEVLAEQLSYWRRQLGGELPVLELPTDKPRSAVQSYRGARESITLSEELTQQLKALSRREGCTLFMTLLAAFQVLFSRYTGQEDIVVGTPIAGRTRAEIEPLIGFFVNTLALRTDLSGDPSFQELLGRVREMTLEAHAHQDLPFEKLVEELQPERDMSRSPLFQVMFAIRNMALDSLSLPGLTLVSGQIENFTSKFDLSLSASEQSGGLHIVCEYSTDLFERRSVEQLLGHYRRVLEEVSANSELRVGEIRLLNEAQERQLVEWNETKQDYAGRGQCLHQLIEAQSQNTPDAVAVVHEEAELTYAELNERANQLAHHLRGLGVGPEVLVGLCLERSLEMIVSVLAVLKAGGAYVPLDPAYPQERVAFMLADAGVSVLLTQSHLLTKLSVPDELRVVCVDADRSVIAAQRRDNPESGVGAENLAYVIYTSGSTGQPKGVMVCHASVVNYAAAASARWEIGPGDRVLQFASLNFDTSAEEIYGSLIRGAALVLRTEDMLSSIPVFLEKCAEWKISVLDLPTAYWHELTAQVEGHDLSLPGCIRLVIIGGEKARSERLAQWRRQAGQRVRLTNTYGPTETTIVATMFDRIEALEQAGDIPIGRPISNVQTYVVDHLGQRVPPGIAGELHVGGEGVARGYLRRPELTAEKFVPDPFNVTPGARLYRTGDLVRYRGDGELEFMGRIDQQVKLRGYRIELGEIEAALMDQAGVRQAVVIASAEEERLVAYVVGEAGVELKVDELRQALRGQLPEYMVPSALAMLEALPLTPNGKLDRRALPALNTVSSGKEYVAPRTPAEEVLAGIYRDVLKLEQVSIGDNFFELGGHSLLATRLISKIRAVFQVELPLRRVFESPTVATMALVIESELRSGPRSVVPPIRMVGRDEKLPLSFAQQRLWFLDQLEPDSAFYNIPLAFRLSGVFNLKAFAQTLGEIVRRHEILRTTFSLAGDDPVQIISPANNLNLSFFNLEALPERARVQETEQLAAEEAQRPFDLSQGPLLRVKILKHAEHEHVVLFTMHHIIGDGWSLGVLVKEVAALYEAYIKGEESPLPELELQYADYAAWQREWLQGEVLEEQLSYWRRQLGGELPALELPADRPRPAVQSYRGARESLVLSEALTEQLKALSRREGCTLFMTLLAAFQALLSRYTGQEDVVVGTPIAGRTRSEVEPLIGLFVNTLALRTDVSGDPSFIELLRRVREVTLGAYAHQDVPFEKLVEELQPERDLSRAPLVNVMLALQNIPQEIVHLSGLELSSIETRTKNAKLDLIAWVAETADGLHTTFEYNTDLFEAATMRRLLSHFEALLSGVLSAPEQRVSRVPLLSPGEWQQLIYQWNETGSVVQASQTISAQFEQQAEQTPASVALVYEQQRLSYAELNERANQLAHHLRELGVGPEVLVGLCLERSAEMIVCLLAVLKAGGAYVPLDPAYPQERLAFMLADAAVSVLLTQTRLLAELPVVDELRVVCVDEDRSLIAAQRRDNPASGVGPDNLAYVIYTSGSTGRPKGVMVTHANVTQLFAALGAQLPLRSGGVWSLCHSYAFDFSVWELWGALLHGSTLVVAPYWVTRTPGALLELVTTEGVTVLSQTPTAYGQLLGEQEDWERWWLASGVELLVLGGEALPRELGNQVVAVGAPGWNFYGPTEATVWAGIRRLEGDGEVSALGRPLAHTEFYVLDTHGEAAPVGVVGELHIGGAGLARGYLQRPELSAEKFIPDRFSGRSGARLYRTGDLVRYLATGELEFVGRRDEQVKLRGYRIELGEIEAALMEQASVREAVVIARVESGEEQRLVGYVVGEAGVEVKADELRQALRAKLPEYMVPSALVVLEALPLTANGKLDRRALPAPNGTAGSEHEYVGPRTPVEEVLAGIYGEVLKLGQVSINDNFFELGGHSLLATRLISKIRAAFQVELPLRRVFESPTVAGLAVIIEDQLYAEVAAMSEEDAAAWSVHETAGDEHITL